MSSLNVGQPGSKFLYQRHIHIFLIAVIIIDVYMESYDAQHEYSVGVELTTWPNFLFSGIKRTHFPVCGYSISFINLL